MDLRMSGKSEMHRYTDSTSISELQWPRISVKDWAKTMLWNGHAPVLLQLIELILWLYQLHEENILFDFISMDERDVSELASEGKESAGKIKQVNGLRYREELWKALGESEAQYISSISDLMPSGKPELNLSIGVNHLCKYTKTCYEKFGAYLEKTSATKSQIASFKNLRHASLAAIAHFSRYAKQVTEFIDIGRIKEHLKMNQRARSASQQRRPAEKKSQNQGQSPNLYQMLLHSKASKILWRTTSVQKRK